MSDQPSSTPDPAAGSTPPGGYPPPPPSSGASAPPPPPAPPAYGQQTPAYGQQPPAGYGTQPTYGANPYGGYAAPPMGAAQASQVQVGSLPYVEHHFGPVAQFGDRVVAYLIDMAIALIGLVPIVLGMIIMAASAGSGSYDEYGNYDAGGSTAGLVIGGLITALGYLAIFGIQIWNRWVRQGRTGQSIGKQKTGLKLVNSTTGQPIGVGMSFVRDFINGLISPITQLWMLWDPNRQTLGDMVAKSTVIKVPKA